jgi:hypothetical protein
MKSTFACTAMLALSVSAALTADAQQTASVGGVPALGYIFDTSARALRPILGIPRAAFVGEPVKSGVSIQSAIVLGGSSQALAISSSGAASLIDLTGRIPTATLPLVGRAQALYSSPRGTAAAVLTENWVGFVTGIGSGDPQLAGLALDAQPVAASVSDDGMYLIAALQDSSILIAGRDGSRTAIAPPSPVSRIIFRPGSTDALAVTADNRAWLVQSGAMTQIASPDDGLAEPVGLGFLPDGNRAVIANSNGAILTVDVRSGEKSSVTCSCNPTRLELMASLGVFRLTEAPAQPQYMFDGSSLQTFFVPAAPTNNIRRPRDAGRRPEE